MGALLSPFVFVLIAAVKGIFKLISGFFLKDLGSIFQVIGVVMVYVALSSLLVTSITTLTSSFTFPMPAVIQQSISCFMPANFIPCISAIVSAKIIVFFYNIKLSILTYLLTTVGKSRFSNVFHNFLKGSKGWK
ncbi:MAG: DUF5455 family protein [Pseudomonadota bacterium]|nr:DUF5455 family protein [Pseudomonadota bacterium]